MTSDAKFPFASVVGVLCCAVAVMGATGINAVLLPVRLQEMGYNKGAIGLCMAAEVAAVVLVSPYVARIVSTLGLTRTFLLAALVRVLCLLVMMQFPSYGVWIPGVFCYGLASNIFITAIITWLSALHLGRFAGLCSGLFSSALSLGTATGPLVLAFAGFSGNAPFQANMLVVVLAIVPVIALLSRIPKIAPSRKPRIFFIMRLSPAVVASAFVGGITFFGLPAFLTLYGIQNNYDPQSASWLLSAFMLGSVILSPVVGVISDYIDRRLVILSCFALGMVASIYLPLAVVSYPATLALLFIWGGSSGGIFAVSIAFLTERFRAEDHISVGVTYTLMDCLGGTIGVFFIGHAMDLDRDGLTYVISSAAILYFIFALTRYRTSPDKLESPLL